MARKKGYIILGKRKKGSYVGYCENSFTMGFDNKRVKVWRWDGPSKYSTGTPQEQKQSFINHVAGFMDELIPKYPTIEWKIYRVGSKDCPVKIEWASYWRMFAINKRHNHRVKNKKNYIATYEARNLRFKRVDQ